MYFCVYGVKAVRIIILVIFFFASKNYYEANLLGQKDSTLISVMT